MKILDNAIIKDKYEVIIIGAGNGGLTAAALLANRGVDVLLIEQHYIPGGCVTALRRQDCTCDIGAAILFGFTPDGFNPHYYIHNVLEEPIDMVLHDSTFCMEWGDKRITFWKDIDKFLDEFTKAFPDKKEQLKAYYDYMFKIHEAVTALQVPYAMTEILSWRHPRIGLAMKSFFRHPISQIKTLLLLNKPGTKIFNKFLKDEQELKAFFDVCQGLFTCTRIDESPAVLSTMMFADMHKGGACYPVGSPQMLPNKLERALERLGGHIIQRQSVEEILFKPDKKTAYGVRLSDGTVIEADWIISNSDAYSLYGTLIKPEYIDPEKLESIQKLKPTTSAVILYMGVDKEVIPEDAHNIEFYIEDKENFFNNCYVFIPSLDDPSICPPDMHSMTVLYPCHEVEWPRPSDPFYQTDDYDGLKDQVAEKILTKLEKWIPNIKTHVRFMEVATPSTVERFTRKYKGHVGGPAQIMGQHFFKRPHTRTEFKNIFLCGDSTFMGEGVVATAASGVSAANVVLKEGKLGKWYGSKKFKKNVINYLPIGPQLIPAPAVDEVLTEKKAQRLAIQCQLCEERDDRGKCRKDCPAEIDILNFIRRIEAGNYNGAARLIREMNPLGEICGAICPAEELCEKECYRLEFDKDKKPTQIKRLQRWACEKAGEDGWEKYAPEPNGYEVAVVGAGPGGLSCAYFLARLGYSVAIFEKEKELGGLMSQAVPSFRLPPDVLNRDLTGVSTYPGINIKYNQELGKDITIPELSNDYDAIFLAPGLGEGRVLELPGIEDVNVIDALTLLKIYKKEGKVDLRGDVLVIGGGSVAADAVSIAVKTGAKKVSLVCLESREEMPALKTEVFEILEGGCEIHDSWGPKEFSKGKVTFMECTSVFDKDGKFAPKFNEGNLKEIKADTVILAVGQTVESSLSAYLEKELSMRGLLTVDPETLQVKGKSNVYAGGDIIRGAGTVVQAVADARRAAKAIHNKLGGKKAKY